MRHKGVKVLLVVVLIVAAIPATVLAQAIPQNFLLDQETQKIASVTVGGQTYTVYRIENVIWYASGIDIYADGERVRSESTARKVLTELAQRRAVEELGSDEVSVLSTATRNVSDASPDVATAAQDINETLKHLAGLRTEQMDDTTAYNASVEAAPGIVEFNETAQDLLPRLRSFDNDSEVFIENATTLINLLEQRENGSSVDPQRLYEVYSSTVQASNALSDYVGFRGIDESLSEVSSLSGRIATNVTSVPRYGDQTAQHFERVANSSSAATNRTDALALPGFEFEQTQERAESLESDWMAQWQSRQNAGKDVSNSIFGLLIAVIVLAGYIRRRRR